MKRIFLITALGLALTNCAPQGQNTAQPRLGLGLDSLFELPGSRSADRLITVIGEKGNPIAGATVLLGSGAGQPFANNVMTTDTQGQIVTPKEWNTPLAVTVDAAGYIRATYFDQLPGDTRQLVLHEVEGSQNIEVKGTPINFGNLPKDGVADFSMVVPTMDRANIFSFGVETAVSSEPDKFSVFGKSANLPSNISFPKQTENYGIIPVTLDKPGYRYFTRKPGNYELAAVRGKFPFKKVADAMQKGQPVSSILNDFSYVGLGLKTVNADPAQTAAQDIPVNQIGISQQFNVVAPQMDASLVMVASVLTEKDSRFFPTDIKLLKSGESFKLGGATGWDNQFSVAAIAPQPQQMAGERPVISKRMSMAFNRFSGAATLAPKFLSLLETPTYDGQKAIMTRPLAPAGVAATITYGVLEEVVKGTNALGNFEVVTKKWEFYAPGWVDQVVPPTWPVANALGPVNRWDVSFVADENQTPAQAGPDAFRTATHMSRNTVDF